MKKMKLDLDDLRVDSFEPAAATEAHGTVVGYDSGGSDPCVTTPPGATTGPDNSDCCITMFVDCSVTGPCCSAMRCYDEIPYSYPNC